jgi:hypothetical protein
MFIIIKGQLATTYHYQTRTFEELMTKRTNETFHPGHFTKERQSIWHVTFKENRILVHSEKNVHYLTINFNTHISV